MAVAPQTLREQVQSTAAWALAEDTPASRALLGDPQDAVAHFRMQLAAHYTTLDTFVPTDVDSRIRFHMWQETNDEATFAAAVATLEEVHGWPVHAVSNRTVHHDGEWLAGHFGEWNSIRAGALGRAHQLGYGDWIVELRRRIRAEIAREDLLLQMLLRTPGKEIDVIKCGALIAHNLGDVARVAEAWVDKDNEDAAWLMALPQAYPVIGEMNRELTANDNHRFLPLRQARCLRESRALILPTGPFFDSFGEQVARVAKDPGDVLACLLEGHAHAPTEQGYQRAIAGLHQATKGGLDRLIDEVPARLRKIAKQGALRQAIDFDKRRFEERIKARYQAKYRPRLLA